MTTNNYTHKYLTNGCWPQRPIAAIKKIVIHHTAAPFDNRSNDERLQQHADFEVKTENWPGLSYHYMIMKDGQIYQLNECTDSSYTDGINYESLAICLDGYFHPDVNNQPTPEQLQSLQDLLDKTINDPNGIVVTKDDVVGHREHIAASLGGTACPGDLLMPYVIQYRTTGKIINNQPNQNTNTDMTTLTQDDVNTLTNLGFGDNAKVLQQTGIRAGDYIDRVGELAASRKLLNDSIQASLFHDAIKNQEFDADTRTNLGNAINDKNANYIVSFSGSEPRKYLTILQTQCDNLKKQILATASTPNSAPVDQSQQNSSTKPIWASKKAILTALVSTAAVALAAYNPNAFLLIRNSPLFPLVATYLLGQSGVDIANIINQTNVTDASKK